MRQKRPSAKWAAYKAAEAGSEEEEEGEEGGAVEAAPEPAAKKKRVAGAPQATHLPDRLSGTCLPKPLNRHTVGFDKQAPDRRSDK